MTVKYGDRINPRKAFIPIGPSIAYIVLTRGNLSLIDRDDAVVVYLGTFKSFRDAAKAYNEASVLYFGEFSRVLSRAGDNYVFTQ